jgi:hypothetical protein
MVDAEAYVGNSDLLGADRPETSVESELCQVGIIVAVLEVATSVVA